MSASRGLWERALEAVGTCPAPAAVPWYRRPETWMALGVIVLPFGWVVVAWRVAWLYATRRSGPRR
jgi:hypothetical protein